MYSAFVDLEIDSQNDIAPLFKNLHHFQNFQVFIHQIKILE